VCVAELLHRLNAAFGRAAAENIVIDEVVLKIKSRRAIAAPYVIFITCLERHKLQYLDQSITISTNVDERDIYRRDAMRFGYSSRSARRMQAASNHRTPRLSDRSSARSRRRRGAPDRPGSGHTARGLRDASSPLKYAETTSVNRHRVAYGRQQIS
jgi:hypothetical protein